MPKSAAKDIFKSNYGKGLKHSARLYTQGLRNHPKDHMSSEFLTPAYRAVAQNQAAQANQLRQSYGSALGANTSGMLGRELAMSHAAAPYGSANLAARRAGFDRFQRLTSGLSGIKNVESAWRNARKSEEQADEALALQAQALEDQLFLGGAGAGGGGGFGNLMGIGSLLGGLMGGGSDSGGGGLF